MGKVRWLTTAVVLLVIALGLSIGAGLQVKKVNSELMQEVKTKETVLQDKENTINKLSSDLKVKSKETEKLKSVVKENEKSILTKDKMIKELKAEKKAQAKKINSLEEINSTLKKNYEQLKAEKAEKAKNAKIALKKKQEEAKAQAEKQVHKAPQVHKATKVVAKKEDKQKAIKKTSNHSTISTQSVKKPIKSSSNKTSGRTLNVFATHYIALCDSGCSGITATGVDVRNTMYYNGMRIIAVDPSVIPLYSLVKVQTPNGTFNAIALDTGGAIIGNHIDILTDDSSQKNISFQATVTVLREGK
ncbi:3D domain-containing protein [Halobacillus rhizosphaerae]|uniref:3D domain-containing protein n=1 Tax=Halobacillus rhizosphaerae TaxID=3064889 RepID=UPI00398AB176